MAVMQGCLAPNLPAWMAGRTPAEKIPEVFAPQKLPAGEWHECHSPAAQGIEAKILLAQPKDWSG
ncbi:MAG: hypothetical protein LBI94_06845 [Treponema sp.]|jgi:hypothetical protein|nr:hypothetical protein [Treponema sp.]